MFVGPCRAGPWQNEEMRVAVDRRVKESDRRFRVIPVLLPGAERGERSRLPRFLTRTTWVEFREALDDNAALHRLICGVQGVEPGPRPGRSVRGAAFSPDGQRVLTAGEDGTARVYVCASCGSVDDVLALARTRVTRALTSSERRQYLHE